VLSLRWPRFTLLGWLLLVISFVIAIAILFGVILAVVKLIVGDIQTGGIVEKTVEGVANHPLAFALIVPSLMIGAPVAEELLFRGQIFTALSQTRIGVAGASVLTAAGWASLHYTGNPLQVVLIFAMGLVLSWLMYRFGSVLVTIVCHSAWNGLVALALLSAGGASP
jgi:membrane protease YdiL (CAAX protease family)